MAILASRIAELILKYLDKTITAEEQLELYAWTAKDEHRVLFQELTNDGLLQQVIENPDVVSCDPVQGWAKLQTRIPELRNLPLNKQPVKQ